MNIAVLGGGNGAYATAADLAEKGHRVRMWRRNREEFAPVLKSWSIVLTDYQGTRTVDLELAGVDLEKVIKGAEVIIIPLPAFSQEALANEIAPYLEDDQIILLPPGTFGSLVMAQELKKFGCQAKVIFAETGTLPYLARKHGEDTVAITTRASRLPTGIFPANCSDSAFKTLKKIFSAIEPVQDVLDAALLNAGPIIHPPLILLNSAPIEHFDRWDIHNEGTQPSVRKVHDALDRERILLRETLGYHRQHFPLADHYSLEGEEWMYGNAAHEKLVDSADWREKLDLSNHRYVREDIGCGLVFLVSVAKWAGVSAPIADSILKIASVIAGTDFYETGRTLGQLGLDGFSKDQMKHLLLKGLPE
ncbi:MAG: NAD/NADP octopine/nopaline dehydrogenase family protein [Dehalobacterium sp.]